MHVTTHFNANYSNFYLSSSIKAFIRVGIPIFFMISGALLIGKSNENFLSKRFSRILEPFIFWVFIYFICEILFFNGSFTIDYFLEYCLLNHYLLHIFGLFIVYWGDIY
jgi:surface polysaccharide O-acyltransferase-like enzyme